MTKLQLCILKELEREPLTLLVFCNLFLMSEQIILMSLKELLKQELVVEKQKNVFKITEKGRKNRLLEVLT